jgi:hypothetical protein
LLSAGRNGLVVSRKCKASETRTCAFIRHLCHVYSSFSILTGSADVNPKPLGVALLLIVLGTRLRPLFG